MSATLPHRGSAYRYDKGCRCDDCRTAKVAKRKRARDRARAENRPSYQRELAASRLLKEARVGKCADCGAETRYNGRTVNGPSEYCHDCAAKRTGKKLTGKGPMQQRLYDLLDSGTNRFSDIARALAITPNHAMAMLVREMRYGRVVRVARGRYARSRNGAA